MFQSVDENTSVTGRVRWVIIGTSDSDDYSITTTSLQTLVSITEMNLTGCSVFQQNVKPDRTLHWQIKINIWNSCKHTADTEFSDTP